MEIGPTSLWLPPTGIGAAGENWQAVFASGQYWGGSLYYSLTRLKEGGDRVNRLETYFDSTSITSSSSSSATSRKNFSNLPRPLAPTLLSSSARASSTVFGSAEVFHVGLYPNDAREQCVVNVSIDEFLAVFGEGWFAVNLPIVLHVGYVSSRQSSVPPSRVSDRALIQYAAEA